MYYEVLISRVFKKTPLPEDGILTYASSQDLKLGHIVLVPLGRLIVPGIIYQKTKKPDGLFKIKSIEKVLYSSPIPNHLLKSILWLNKYYLAPLSQITNLFLPAGIAKSRRSRSENDTKTSNPAPTFPKIPLNPAQKNAISSLKSAQTPTRLLHGITGSGKTNIYLSLAEETFKKNKSTILLVPEIALTSQLVHVFKNHFSANVVLIHSKQTEAERHITWEKLLENSEPKIIIGPRSALLAPVQNLGLIIIDEAHESTYFQEQPPKYSSLRLASFIAKTLDIPCIFGTATPLITDYYLAKSHDSYVPLLKKAKDTAIQPTLSVIDLKNRQNFSKNRYFSDQLLNEIEKNLIDHKQTLIFHNRRGSAPLTICESCGWQALCPTCFLPLTLHADSFKLVCHTCGLSIKVPSSCPDCQHPSILFKGFGTKLLETELKKLFKDARIARFDADNDQSSSLENLYDTVKNGEIDIIIGTQIIARGFDFPSLVTVGIVQADSGLSLPDYSAEERTFHLISQVLGRVGRGHIEKASAIIQTFQPDHPVIQTAIKNDYDGFSNYLLKKRQKSHLPPFFYLARLSVVYKTEKTTLSKIKKIHAELTSKHLKDLVISKPTPAFHERTPSGYTWQIILRSRTRKNLIDVISHLSDFSNIRFTIDPPSLL